MANQNPFITSVVRCAFPSVFNPEISKDDPTKKTYTITLLFPKDDPKLLELKKLVGEAVGAAFDAKYPKDAKTGRRNKVITNPLKDSLVATADSNKIPAEDYGYGDCVYVRCTSQFKPGLIDQNKNEILDPEKVYGGCFVRCALNTYTYDNKKTGVGVGLLHVQFAKDGEPFSTNSNERAKDTFDTIEGGQDDPANYAGDEL